EDARKTNTKQPHVYGLVIRPAQLCEPLEQLDACFEDCVDHHFAPDRSPLKVHLTIEHLGGSIQKSMRLSKTRLFIPAARSRPGDASSMSLRKRRAQGMP